MCDSKNEESNDDKRYSPRRKPRTLFRRKRRGIEPDRDKRAAIFAYIDRLGGGKSFNGGPLIQVHGPFVSTHKRHFVQQAWYTTAVNWSQKYEKCIFCSHHEIFDKPNHNNQQDLLIKITIPATERKLALKELFDYNINHYTLFQTEDALARALSIREFDINES